MLTTKYLLLIIFYTKFQIPLFFKKKNKIFFIFLRKGVDIKFHFWYSIICREGEDKESREMRYAEVSELADEQD